MNYMPTLIRVKFSASQNLTRRVVTLTLDRVLPKKKKETKTKTLDRGKESMHQFLTIRGQHLIPGALRATMSKCNIDKARIPHGYSRETDFTHK